MNMISIKNSVFGLFFVLASFFTLPAQAWPEVDHMNMCGSATKAVQAGFTNWAQYDRYVADRGNAYYLRTNCPDTVAPVKKAKYAATVKRVTQKPTRRYSKAVLKRAHKRRAAYNKKLDCARVDRLNSYNSKRSYRIPQTKNTRIAKSPKARAFKRRVKYDLKADCARVDRMNGFSSH